MSFAWLGAATVPVFGTVIIPLASMYAALKLHKLDLVIEVLNLIWLPMLYNLCDPSFISTQFFCPKFSCLISCIVWKIYCFFDIALLYYHKNVRLSIHFCLSSGKIYLSLRISSSCSFLIVSELFYCNCFVIFSAILLPIKLLVACAVFWYYIIILYYSKFINNLLSFFWRYISFFTYFFIIPICNCFWIILLWIS